MSEYNLDEIVAQHREAVGGDDVVFTLGAEKFSFPHPVLADDDWKDSLPPLSDGDVAQVQAMLGDEQYERFRAAGGQSGMVMLLVRKVQEDMRDEDTDGRPTRPSTSSRKRRRR